jgi:phenylacetate-CoA ligase
MKYWLEKKFSNFITLVLLNKYMYTYRRSQKDPLYWKKKQKKEIKKFVKYIYKIPFYRERFKHARICPDDIKCEEDFLRLPVLDKEEYKQWMEDEYEKSPEKYKHWIKNYTSGSSGTPMMILQKYGDNSADVANFFRGVLIQKKKYRLFLDKTFAITYKEKKRRGGYSILQKLGMMDRRVFPGATPVDLLIDEFNRFKPDIYHGLHSPFLLMVQYAQEKGIDLHCPKLVCTMGERLDNATLHTFEKAFPGTVYNLYGSTESGNMAVSLCSEPQEEEERTHMIWQDTHILNVVDENGVHATEGKLLITTMHHKGFPLVNYDIGDLIEIHEEKSIKKIKRIIGRENDLIFNRDGSYYTHATVNRLISGIEGISQFRAIQEDYELVDIYIVLSPKYSKDRQVGKEKKKEIERRIIEKVPTAFYKAEKKVRVFFIDTIPIDKTGKRRLLISKVKPKQIL